MSLPESKFTLPPDVVEALRHGNKIEAIKRLLEAARVGLAEAKAMVEAQSADRAPAVKVVPHHKPTPGRPHGLSPGEVPRASAGPAAFVILIAILALGAWLYSQFG